MVSGPDQQIAAEVDIRPSVALIRKPLPPWVFFGTLAMIAIVLFVVLDGRRRALQAPAVAAGQVDLAGGTVAPMLFIPPNFEQEAPMIPPAPPVVVMPERPAMPLRPVVPPTPPQSPPVQAYFPPSTPGGSNAPAPKANNSSPVLVIDNGGAGRAQSAPRQVGQEGEGAQAASAGAAARVLRDTSRQRAGSFANRSTSVVQGTLIPAVLESALDSTRPGFARAIVSRDVRGFDGSRVLIPRGSRLIGEYESDAKSGENRALINWTRLIRPDGATVAIDSPAADPLGRNGVRARVNSHFLERFGGAILQSVLDIGVNAAARAADSPTVIALPGSFGGAASQRIQPQQVTPTLTVKRGTSISIFVARDLDFTGVEQGRR